MSSSEWVDKAAKTLETRPGDLTRWEQANYYMLRALYEQQKEHFEAVPLEFYHKPDGLRDTPASLRKSARASGANTPSPAPREPRKGTARAATMSAPPTPEQEANQLQHNSKAYSTQVELDYHTYDPNFQAGGDCNVCGHGFDFWAHLSYPMGHKPSHSNGEAPGVSWCTEHERFEVE